jgi:hypothetical protein
MSVCIHQQSQVLNIELHRTTRVLLAALSFGQIQCSLKQATTSSFHVFPSFSSPSVITACLDMNDGSHRTHTRRLSQRDGTVWMGRAIQDIAFLLNRTQNWGLGLRTIQRVNEHCSENNTKPINCKHVIKQLQRAALPLISRKPLGW